MSRSLTTLVLLLGAALSVVVYNEYHSVPMLVLGWVGVAIIIIIAGGKDQW